MTTKTKLRYGFKSKDQLPLFMHWIEYWENGDVVFAKVIFSTYELELGLKRFWHMIIGAFGSMAGS